MKVKSKTNCPPLEGKGFPTTVSTLQTLGALRKGEKRVSGAGAVLKRQHTPLFGREGAC